MEDKIISEIRGSKQAAVAVQPEFTPLDQDLEDCLSMFSDDFKSPSFQQPQPTAPIPMTSPSTTFCDDSLKIPPPPPPPYAWEQPRIPVQQKIQKLLCSARYRGLEKAGELAVQLAVLLIGEGVMKRSGLGDHQGKLRPLDENKMGEIEDIIKRVYRGHGEDVDKIWKFKCRTAIAKKCQRLRKQM